MGFSMCSWIPVGITIILASPSILKRIAFQSAFVVSNPLADIGIFGRSQSFSLLRWMDGMNRLVPNNRAQAMSDERRRNFSAFRRL